MSIAQPVAARRSATAPAGAARVYGACVAVTLLATTWVLRLWRADWSVPFYWSSDAISSAGHFKTTMTTGWYENQPDLGFPYGQHYHDFPFTDDLQPAVIKLFGLFTSRWEIAFNVYYVLGFPLAALGALWFFRRCRVPNPLAVALSVLFALAPYHFYRNETHFFLGEYWMVPFAVGILLAVVRGAPIWGSRELPAGLRWPIRARRVAGALTGRGAGTAVIMAATMLSGAYYGAFTGLILAVAAVLTLVRRRNWRRFGGAVVAGAVLVAALMAALIPDVLYARRNGVNPGGFVRHDGDIEFYSAKPLQLLLPADTYPIPVLNRLREHYDSAFPVLGENPALGTAATVGFLLLAGVLVLALVGRWGRSADAVVRRRGAMLFHLAVLTAVAFLFAMTGGLGSVVGLVTNSIRDWNRLSIFIGLLSLAGLGVALSGAVALHRPPHAQLRRRIRWVAAAVLVIGVADQSLGMAVPEYAAAKTSFTAEQQLVDQLEAELPDGAAIFQLPYQPWPESPPLNQSIDNDQLRMFLHSTTLKWSGGGFKGRPQTDWTAQVAGEPTGTMVKDLAIIGFAGVVVDRYGYADGGRAQETDLRDALGRDIDHVSSDGRWSYFSLADPLDRVRMTMSPTDRQAEADRLTRRNG